MGAIETYNARVAFQERLDEMFPEGTWAAVAMLINGREVPTGIEFPVGRVFCSNAAEAEGLGWVYELFFDTRTREDHEAGISVQPFTLWMDEFVTESELFAEARLIGGEAEEIVRMLYEPRGPRAVPAGHREFITELREAELFPRGLQPIETAAVEA